jgi:hypothetical protein
MSRLVGPPSPELLSPGDSRTTAPGLLFEDGLLFGSAISVQLQPPLCREPIFADGLCLCDIGQEFLLECVSHNAEFKPCPEFRTVGLPPVPSHGGIPRGVFKTSAGPHNLDCPPRLPARRFAFQRALNHLDRLLGSGVFPLPVVDGEQGCSRRGAIRDAGSAWALQHLALRHSRLQHWHQDLAVPPGGLRLGHPAQAVSADPKQPLHDIRSGTRLRAEARSTGQPTARSGGRGPPPWLPEADSLADDHQKLQGDARLCAQLLEVVARVTLSSAFGGAVRLVASRLSALS